VSVEQIVPPQSIGTLSGSLWLSVVSTLSLGVIISLHKIKIINACSTENYL
jgi:hypothetical protein